MSKDKTTSSSFIMQASILAGAGLFVRFIGFLYRLPMTALIGDAGNAAYSAGYNVYNFLLILSSAGLPAAIGRLVSERIALKEYRNAHKVFRVSLIMSGSLGLLFSFLLFFNARFVSEAIQIPNSYYTLLTLSPTIFIVAIMSVFRGYFQGMNTMVPTAVSQIVEQIFNAVFSVLLAYILVKQSVPLGAAGGTAGTGIGAVAGLCVVVFAYFAIRPSIFRNMKRESKSHVSEKSSDVAKVVICTAVPIILGTAIFSITNLLDMKMVVSRLLSSGAFNQDQAEILYGQLQGKYVTITTLPVAISTSIATAAVPNIAASAAVNDRENVKQKLNIVFRVAMIITIPAAIGLLVLGDQVVRLLFPTQPGGGILLQVGSISVIFLALYQIVTGLLQGVGKIKAPVISAFCGACVKIILNYFLIAIPQINVVGAVLSTIACYIVASAVNLHLLSKYTGVRPDYEKGLVKPLIGSAVMGLICYILYNLLYLICSSNAVSTLITVAVGVAAYGTIMIFIGGITKDDLRLVPKGDKIIKFIEKFEYEEW